MLKTILYTGHRLKKNQIEDVIHHQNMRERERRSESVYLHIHSNASIYFPTFNNASTHIKVVSTYPHQLFLNP